VYWGVSTGILKYHQSLISVITHVQYAVLFPTTKTSVRPHSTVSIAHEAPGSHTLSLKHFENIIRYSRISVKPAVLVG